MNLCEQKREKYNRGRSSKVNECIIELKVGIRDRRQGMGIEWIDEWFEVDTNNHYSRKCWSLISEL